MAKFRLVFKGYCVEDVDAYIKETEEKIALLERTAAGKTPVIENDLIRRESELTQKAKALDNTFKAFVGLIKSKLNADEVNEFMLIAQNIEKITKPMSEKYFGQKKNHFEPLKFTSEEPLGEETEIYCAQNLDTLNTDTVHQNEDVTVYEDTNQSDKAEANIGFSNIVDEKCVAQTENEQNQQSETDDTKSVAQTENEQNQQSKTYDKISVKKPLIDLKEIEANPTQSLEEMCKDLGFMG